MNEPQAVDITCPPDEKLAQFVARTLAPDGMQRLEDHVAACSSCYHVVAAYARVYCGAAPPGTAQPSNPTGSSEEKVARLGRSGGLAKGTVVGRYVVVSWIGEGGAGVVYSAYDPELDRKVALKLIRPGAFVCEEERVREALSREARAMAKLAHPNATAIYDIGAFEGRVFIAMEFVEGVTLRRWLDETKPERSRILEMFVECGRGLAAAHQADLVHRDFKPENVLVGTDGRARVTDFGLARLTKERGVDGAPDNDAARADGPRRMAGNATAGTPAYMAPEQRLGHADARSDQFSFCVALYEALCGARPSGPDALPAFGVLPLRVRKALSRGLQNNAADRYSSMSDLLEELESELRGRSRRAWTWVLALVVSAAGIGFGMSQRVTHAKRPVCTGAMERFAGIWDPVRKEAIAGSIRATGKPFAEDAWRGVERALDDYTRAWAAEHTDACEATRVRGEQSEPMLDLRMQCMQRRLIEVRELGDVLAHADGSVAESAVKAAQGLAPPSTCAALRMTAHQIPAEEAVAELLARAVALRSTGQFDAARTTAQSALEQARDRKLGALEGEALSELGVNAVDRRDGAGAEPLLSGAIEAAEGAGQDDGVAHAAVALAQAVGERQDRTVEAFKWLGLASSAIDRIGGDDRLRADVMTTRSNILSHEGKYADAFDAAQAAASFTDERLPNDVFRRALAHSAVGRALQPLLRTPEAELELRQALALFTEALGKDHPRVGVALANVAVALHDQNEFEPARALFEQALAISKKLGPGYAMVPELWSALGMELTFLGRYDEARDDLNRALALAGANPGVAKIRLSGMHLHLGELDRLQKRYDEAIVELTLANEILTRAVGADNPDNERALLALGRVYLDRGEPAKALPPLEKAYALLVDAGDLARANPGFALARALWQAGGDRHRADALVGAARAVHRDHPALAYEVRDIEAWFQQHAPELRAK